MKVLIKGGKLVDFKNNCFIIRDILINNKMIERIERNIRLEEADQGLLLRRFGPRRFGSAARHLPMGAGWRRADGRWR